eukprot:TRINITY_DN334_c0_g1_i5.p1 TRINITY_DN334_c0_g1~~TRINITY_DN334_c0_g1_i5.p1  ORF type:complete len:726 (-),score=130.14 TRINITY_DN334_c0_g1_i5:52-2229(-)
MCIRDREKPVPFKKIGDIYLCHQTVAKPRTAQEIFRGVNDKKMELTIKLYEVNDKLKTPIERVGTYCSIMNIRIMQTSTHEKAYFILDNSNAGSLDKYLLPGKKFDKHTLDTFIIHIAKQLISLHEKGIYHGEITPEQILIHIDSTGKTNFKICGFGHYIPKEAEFLSDEKISKYIAKSELKADTPENAALKLRSDIWSFGLILYQMATGNFPTVIDGVVDEGAFEHQKDLSPSLAHLLRRCLKPDESERIQAEDILYHPYFIPTRASLDPYVLASDKPLGTGSFAEVFLIQKKDDPTKHYAMKKIKPIDKLEEKYQMLVLSEISVLMKLKNCPYAVNLIDYFQIENTLHLMLEFCNGGDIESYLRAELKGATAAVDLKDEMRLIAYSLAAGIKSMHKQHIIHRDIKPKNLLVVRDPVTHKLSEVKLADFGTAREALLPAETYCGTQGYLAPEIVAQETYGREVDVWSYGVTLFCMAYGIPPSKVSPAHSIYKQKKILFPSNPIIKFTPLYMQLMKKCLEFDPKKRPSMDTILTDPYFKAVPIAEKPTFLKEYSLKEKPEKVKKVGKVEYLPTKTTYYLKTIEGAEEPESKVRTGLEEEIAVTLRLCHLDTIVRIHEYFMFDKKIHLIIDCWDLGNLLNFMKTNEQPDGGLEVDLVKRMGLDIVKTVAAIFQRGVAIHDLSPSSIFIQSRPKAASPKVMLGGLSLAICQDYICLLYTSPSPRDRG